VSARLTKAKEYAEPEARETKERAEREAKQETERKERGKIEREEKEKAEREAKWKAEREAKKEAPASKIPYTQGLAVGKNEWTGTWYSCPTEKEEHSAPPPIVTSSVAGGLFDGPGNFDFLSTGKKDSPGGADKLELRTPLTKKGRKGKRGISSLSNLSKLVTPTEPAGVGKFDVLEDLNMNNMFARVSISSGSGNERWTDAGLGPSPTEPTPPALVPELGFEALLNATPELLETLKEVKDEAPTTPKPWPATSLTPAPAPAKTEPEKPLSLWERKKLKATPPAPASSLFGGGDGTNSSGV
jgi:hypothetical protein